jgi:hypothetical protein
MSINIATKGLFPGSPISITTAGRFRGPLIRLITTIGTFITKPIKYFFISKNATEK